PPTFAVFPYTTLFRSEAAVVVHAGPVVEVVERVHGDDVVLHADHLGHAGDAAGAVAQAADVHDQVDGGCDLLADGPHRQVEAGRSEEHTSELQSREKL